MGKALIVLRLAVRNVRRRPGEAALLVLAIMAPATMLTVGLALHGVTDNPYQRTRDATAGADIVASVEPEPRPNSHADRASLKALIDVPGVVDHSGPFPATRVELVAGDISSGVLAVGRDATVASVDQPELTDGEWVTDGGVVVEAAFAEALDVDAGDQITLNGRAFRVVGVAVTAATSYYDLCFSMPCKVHIDPPSETSTGRAPPPNATTAHGQLSPLPDVVGLIWVSRSDIGNLAPDSTAWSYVLNLRLANPDAAAAFVNENSEARVDAPFLASWQDIRDRHDDFIRSARRALVTFGSLLMLLALAGGAVLVSGRVADQTRRVGLLKAAGATPEFVAVVLLAEYIVLAVVAAAAGLAIGRLAAPLLSDPGAGLIGSAGAPSLTMSTIAVVNAVAVGVAVAASALSAVRAARTSTVHALADAARGPRRTRWLIALTNRLPVPLLLGGRAIARRPRRMLIAIANIAVMVSGIVAVLAGRTAISADWEGPSSLNPQADRANQILVAITVLLFVLAAINAIVITWSTALDTRHTSAVARALGATPGQVGTGLACAQVLPTFGGAPLGSAGGLVLWSAISDNEANPSYPQLLTVITATVLAIAALTTIPAYLATRRSINETLRAERS